MMTEQTPTTPRPTPWRTFHEPDDAATDAACLLIELWVDSCLLSWRDGRPQVRVLHEPADDQGERLDHHLDRLPALVPWLVPVASFEGRAVVSFVATLGIA